jgi:hypothetical protein
MPGVRVDTGIESGEEVSMPLVRWRPGAADPSPSTKFKQNRSRLKKDLVSVPLFTLHA